MQKQALLGMGGGLVPFSCIGLPPCQLGGWGSAACSWHGWQAASPSCGLPLQKRAMFGKLAGVVFGLGLSAILCMETNPNQPPLACLLGFSGITSLVIMVWLKTTAAGLGLGQLQLFAICPTLPPFESCLF